MRGHFRLMITFAVLLSAVALVPQASLGSGAVNWQRFHGAYLTPTGTPASTPTNTPTPTATPTETIPTALHVSSVEAGDSSSDIAWLPLLGLLALGMAAYLHRRRVR